jgi:hypothetical protein
VKQIRKRLTYANVMSSIAVFLVIGGATAFAAGHLGKNTVGAKQLKKNAVTTAKIKNEAVTGVKIKKGTITGANLDLAALGTVPSATNATHATTADSATHVTNADNANNATAAASPTTLASGKTETGVYATVGNGGSAGGYVGADISFPFPLASPPKPHYIAVGEGSTPECPGSAENPKAAPGQLCAYEIESYGTTGVTFFDEAFTEEGLTSSEEGATRFGAQVAAETETSASHSGLGGIWAVTAP